MHKVLIVEDHETLGYVLREYLQLHGLDCSLAESAEQALKLLKRLTPHLCLLDVSLPGASGFELAEKIKSMHPAMPLIFLTARGLKVDRIKGLMLNADDYLVKPVDEEELLLRIRSVLRRSYPEKEQQKMIHTIGKLTFEPANQVIKNGTKEELLTEKESAILDLLCRKKGDLVHRNQILKDVWGKTDQFTARTMDVHLTRIRKRLSADSSIAIVNIHGKGFILKDENNQNPII
jgi:two-component system, OmpR family, response regulator